MKAIQYKKEIVNYRNKHIIIAIGCAFLIISRLISKGQNDIVELIFGLAVIGVQALFGRGSNYEKEDEMVKENLAKANKAALIAFFVISVIIPIIYLEAKIAPVDIGDVYANPYVYLPIAVLGIRSIAYLINDRPVREEEE